MVGRDRVVTVLTHVLLTAGVQGDVPLKLGPFHGGVRALLTTPLLKVGPLQEVLARPVVVLDVKLAVTGQTAQVDRAPLVLGGSRGGGRGDR